MNAFKPPLTYIAFVVLFSLPFWWCAARGHGPPALLVIALMWCPAAAAMLCTFLFRRPWSSLGWRWPLSRFLLIGYTLPILYGVPAYLVVWASGLGKFPSQVFLRQLSEKLHLPHASDGQLILVSAILVGVLWDLTGGVFAATGEELGWRGFLVPVLMQRFHWITTSVITGIVWAAWHYPLFFYSTYHSTAPMGYSILCFTSLTIGLSILMTWLRLRSNSVWPCALLHASHNCWVQGWLTPLTAPTPQSKWWIDNFGAMLPLFVAVLAAILVYRIYRKRGATEVTCAGA